ncbi:MAG: multicomponent Na+:H+ antiporter subunit E [Paracoccaceae bacterium]|jgi:multicomponent Na+:H+ antiporter subunit E
MKLILLFPLLYLWDVLVGGLRVARDILSPKPKLHPVLLKVPVSLASPTKRFFLANLISMTPGTVSIAEEDEGRILVVHSLYGGENPKAVITEIQDRYEKFLAQLP